MAKTLERTEISSSFHKVRIVNDSGAGGVVSQYKSDTFFRSRAHLGWESSSDDIPRWPNKNKHIILKAMRVCTSALSKVFLVISPTLTHPLCRPF